MQYLREKKGYSLIELMLSLAIGISIIIAGAVWGSNRVNEANAKNNEQNVMLTFKNMENYVMTNSPDGSSKATNPINNNVVMNNEILPFEAKSVNGWLVNKDLGSFQFGYSTDYPNSNVLEFRVKDIDKATCSRFVSQLPGKILEIKLGTTYLPHRSSLVNGKTIYNVNTSKALSLCDGFIKSSTNNIMTIRYFASPDMKKIYNVGGDFYGSADSNTIGKEEELKNFRDAFKYTYDIRENNIKSNISNN